MPPTTPDAHGNGLIYKPDGLYFNADFLTYWVTGLKNYNLDRLKITLQAYKPDKPETFHLDSFDLCTSRGRENFAEGCQKYLKVNQTAVMHELGQLIKLLQAEQVRMREGGASDKKPVTPMTAEEKKEALAALKDPNLCQRIIDDFNAIGYIGENVNKLLGYIASISRLLADPLALMTLSRSGAGKTSLQEAICKFVPPESAIEYTRITGQSLFYREENALKHKVLSIEEQEGMQDAMYSVKTLISRQRLSVGATRADSKTGKFSTDDYVVHGPVVVIVATTNPNSLNDEEKRRFLILTIDESEEQTANIIQTLQFKNKLSWLKTSFDESSITRLHHNMQRLLKPLVVTFPDDIKIDLPAVRLQMRGESQKFMSLVKSITLLHQHQRKRGTEKKMDGTKFEYVIASQKDVDLAFRLGRAIFVRNIDDVSPTGRTLLDHIDQLITLKEKAAQEQRPDEQIERAQLWFTRKELREFNGWSEAQVRQNIGPLVDLGYVGTLSGRHGSTFRYILLDNGKNDPLIDLSGKNGFTKNQ